MTVSNTGDRFWTALLFTFIGPVIGSAALYAFAVFSSALSSGLEWSGAFSLLSLFAVVGYIFGIGPALFAGVIYALLPGALQRLVLSPLYGAAATWLFFAAAMPFNPAFGAMGQSSMLWVTGAFAAFGCALIARILGLTPKHDGGEPHVETENTAH